MAQITKRGSTWTVRVFLGRDARGKKLFHNKTIRGTKKDAKAYADRIERERDQGTLVERSGMTVNDLLDRWLSRQKSLESPSRRTLMDYEKHLARHVRPHLGDRFVNQIAPADIDAILVTLAKRGSRRVPEILRAPLRASFEYAIQLQVIRTNPAAVIKFQKSKATRPELTMKALDAQQARKLLDAAAFDRFGLAFLLAMETGMRPGEFLGLQWKDIDFEAGTVKVQRALSRGLDGWYFHNPKTPKSRRTIPLSAPLRDELKAHRHAQAVERTSSSADYQDHDLVFATSEGSPLNDRNLNQRHFKPLLKLAGLPRETRVYDLRHTCATLLLAAGEHIKVVSERLGHTDVALTLNTYIHVLPTQQEAATGRMECLLFGGTPLGRTDCVVPQ